MKKQSLISIAAAAFAVLATNAFAADDANAPASPAATPGRHQLTIEEARKHAHDRAEKLDKMSPEEYKAKQEKRHEFREKWKKMTPEEKEAFKKSRREARAHKDATTPATTPAPSSVPAAGQ
jgi:hypothetical protein